jgi:hypothetical protein
MDAGLGAVVEIDAQRARLDGRRSGDRIVVTLSGELCVSEKETSLNCAAIYCPNIHNWMLLHGEKAIAVPFQQSLQFCPANAR